jgi:DNA repair exonuclease SbcCD nuclease subunit
MFKEFSNVTVIEEPTVIEFHKKIFMCPWLVNNEEYDSINNYDADYMFAHMDLNDFVMSGTDTVCDHGISHKKLSKFETVLIGHYHRRQTKDNVTYIGNPFSTSYGELDDNKGFTVFDLEHNTLELVKFDGPRYCKVNLSDIIDNRVEIPDNVNCKIIADVSIEYSELMELKKTIQESRNVLSLSFEELPVKYYADDVEEISDTRNISINDSIIEMLKNIESKEINNKLLVKIYNSL